tara:strand:+ start:7835 stop:8164 length:330 start_codon:yes stop_codon:yes gene_type:complete
MDVIAFLEMAWPIVLAVVGCVAASVKIQSKVNSLCTVQTRLQKHASDLLTWMNKSSVLEDRTHETLNRIESQISRHIDKSEKTTERIWEQLEAIGNRVTHLEAKKDARD